MAGDDSIGGYVNLFHPEIGAPVGDKHIQFPERTRVKKKIKPFPGIELSFFPSLFKGFFSTHFRDCLLF